MPFKSQKQRAYLNANPEKLGKELKEFNEASKGKKLPKKALKKKGK